MADWDGAGLPDDVLRENFSRGFRDTVTKTAMDTGRPKRRRRFTAAPKPIVHAHELNDTQLAAFETFFETTTKDGSLSFTKNDPLTGTQKTYTLKNTPKPVTPSGYNTYILVLELEELP